MQHIKKYSFMFSYAVAALPLMGFIWGGVSFFIPLAIIFVVVPLIDHWFHDSRNPTPEQEAKLNSQLFYRLIALGYVPLQIALLSFILFKISQGQLTTLELVGLTISTGVLMTGGIGICLSHELMHKRSLIDQLFSKVLLTCVCYGHFFVEHQRGHHVRVATPEDPASARFNENFYTFWVRTLFGGFISAWSLEAKRLKIRKVPIYSWRNQFWWIVFAPIIVIANIYFFLGTTAALFFVIQAIAAFTTLEVVNYVEHYGLTRKKLDSGRYERVQPKHSWNSNNWLSNILIFHLQRHSDHHTRPEVPYQSLHHIETCPQLPSGYTGMFVLALVPPLWFWVMNPRVKAWKEQSFAS